MALQCCCHQFWVQHSGRPNACSIHHRVWATDGPGRDDKANLRGAEPRLEDRRDDNQLCHFHNNNADRNLANVEDERKLLVVKQLMNNSALKKIGSIRKFQKIRILDLKLMKLQIF